MRISFIRQLDATRNLLVQLHDRAREEESQFTSTIHQSLWNIEHIINTYNEVLRRDADEDVSYMPPLREIKDGKNDR